MSNICWKTYRYSLPLSLSLPYPENYSQTWEICNIVVHSSSQKVAEAVPCYGFWLCGHLIVVMDLRWDWKWFEIVGNLDVSSLWLQMREFGFHKTAKPVVCLNCRSHIKGVYINLIYMRNRRQRELRLGLGLDAFTLNAPHKLYKL